MEGFVSVVCIYKDFGESAFCFWIVKVQGSSQKPEKEAQRRRLSCTRSSRNGRALGGHSGSAAVSLRDTGPARHLVYCFRVSSCKPALVYPVETQHIPT